MVPECHMGALILSLSSTLKDQLPLLYRCRNWRCIKVKQLLTVYTQADNQAALECSAKAVGLFCIMFHTQEFPV